MTVKRLLPTTVVGSYPQPDWLIDRAQLQKVPRVRMPQVWRVPEPWLDAAQDDATIVAIRDQERAGVDIVTDGEIRRESYSSRFSNALSGVDDEPGIVRTVVDGEEWQIPVPLFSGPIRRTGPVEVEDVAFLRANTDRQIRITLPGPFTMSQLAATTHYADREEMAMDLAAAVNEEILDLHAAGADVVQLDEPWMERFHEEAKRYGVKVLDRALAGVEGMTAVHICFGYGLVVGDGKPRAYHFLEELEDTSVDHVSIETAQSGLDLSTLSGILPSKRIAVGVLDLGDERVETPEAVAARIEAALEVIPAERLIVAPDCGMKYLSRAAAFGKLQAMVAGADLVRARLT
jgi:5-methyltetrahydropteroyltriglutamate--homocysteine methyltransferase